MKGFINGIDWLNISPMKYWSFASGTSDQVKKDTVRNAVFGGDYIGALKVDGYYQRVLKDEDGNIFMIARSRNVNGEIVDKHEWLPHLAPWFDALPNGTCLLCECYWPGNEGSKNITSILGCLKDKAIARQAKAPLHLYAFDLMAYNGTNCDELPYEDRARALRAIAGMKNHQSPYVEWAEYYEGQELWTKLQEYLASGREGMVIMRKDAIVYNKRTPARVSIKVKKELRQTIDCFFTGRWSAPTKEYTGKELPTWEYWENLISGELVRGQYFKEYKNGQPLAPVTKSYFNHWAGSLEIGVYDGDEIISIGWLAGVTEEMKADPQKYSLKPIEVTAMEWDADAHTLRHGKMIGWRPDLNLSDCTLEKIEG